MIFTRAFQPDETYDRDHATNGVSRYGSYLVAHRVWFDDAGEPTTDAVLFAAAAWRVAQWPAMSPGYVRPHGRVQYSAVRRDQEQRPAVCVELAVSVPPEAAILTHPWRHWTRDDNSRWRAPSDYTRPNAVTVLSLDIRIVGEALPYPNYRDTTPDTDTAKQAVQAICSTLNAALAHVLAFDSLTGDER